MTSLPFFQIDAFTDQLFAGNPAGVVPLDTWLPDATLQAIAMENNLPETAFFVAMANGDSDFELRWFTPTTEVPLCGHATLASAHVLFSHLGFAAKTLKFQTREKGVLTVQQTSAGTYALNLPAAMQTLIPDAAHIGAKLNLTILEAYDGPFLLLVLPNAHAVSTYAPDFAALRALGKEVIITAAGGETGEFSDLDFVSRMFAPTIGIDEDPVTGAAHAQLTPYWTLVLQQTNLEAAQIGPRAGRLQVEMLGNQVQLRGQACTYVSGQIHLQTHT